MMFIGLATSLLLAEDLHKEFKTASGKKLIMNLESGGEITVVGWDKDVVSVDVHFLGGDDEDSKVSFDETAAGVEVYSEYSRRRRSHNSSPKFDVRVPKKYDLDLDSKGGAFNIAGVQGELEGTTMGGALELTQLKGTVNFKTMGGKIRLTKSEVDGEVKTNGGKVSLEDVIGNVNGHSMGGAVTYKNVSDRKGNSTGEEVRVTTMGGEINVDDAPHGADVSTMGGDVEVHSAAEFVKAKTMGGDIMIDQVDGWVRAETMGGDVNVTMTGDPAKGKRDVTISSKGGDITLVVPKGLSMDVDITIAYTNNSWHRERKEVHVESDFDLKQEKTNEWNDREGTPRKYIYATGSIAGGKNKININTINGSVYLKEGK
jgi:DUF4097 and DUF4098 domain-containing protein YvlB